VSAFAERGCDEKGYEGYEGYGEEGLQRGVFESKACCAADETMLKRATGV